MAQKPHALCIPIQGHGHINALLKLANVLHSRGFHITFVNPEFKTRALLESQGTGPLPNDFRFEKISDGATSKRDIIDATSIVASSDSMAANGLVLINNLIAKLNSSSDDPPVSCIIWDSLTPCIPESVDYFDIPQVLFWSMSASVLMTYLHNEHIIAEMGLLQDKDQEFMETYIDFIPGLENFRVKDLPSFFWDGNSLHNFMIQQTEIIRKASAIILHTFDALESEVLREMKTLLPQVYTIGPLNCIEQQIPYHEQQYFRSNLFKENQESLNWLNSQKPYSVVYVSFGTNTVINREQLTEFAWGLANCKHPFLWIIRTNLVKGEEATLPRDFIEETADRSMICSWCPQEKVLHHPSTAVFLTHSGWNSIMDTMSAGVPVINWPFFCDQQTNCWSACVRWGIGMEIDRTVKRDAIEGLIREAMEGLKGKEMKKSALEWKKRAEESTKEGGSSCKNLEKLIKEVLFVQKTPG